MPTVEASLEYLRRMPLYTEEKPYWCLLPPQEGFDPDQQRVDNLEFELSPSIAIEDIRDFGSEIQLENWGFQVINHRSELLTFENEDDIQAYRIETASLLKRHLDAEFVKCYDSRLRVNIPQERREYNINDPLLIEGPARGAHNDVTYNSAFAIVNENLSAEEKERFLKPGYRLRILNTWRPLVAILEDRPLALCDGRSVSLEDLIAADRILPDRVGEVYYLHYNETHKWYWLEKQTPAELFAFAMFDTKEGSHSRFSPHVSFINPRASKNASPRQSIETRSIIVTKE